MLAKVKKNATRYRVVVLGLRPRKGHRTDEDIFVNEGDYFFGYSHPQHKAGKYFDLWLAKPLDRDPDNFVTFGRIKSIVPVQVGQGKVMTTRMGRFHVLRMS